MSTQAPFVAVPRKLQDFAKIEYQLQMSLGTCTAVIKDMWQVSNSKLNLLFERKVTKNKMLTIDSFVDTASLDKSANLEQILREGFDFPPEGKMFSTGFFKLEKPHSAVYRILLCTVAVGKSLCVPVQSSVTDKFQITKKDLDPAFDSVYLKYQDEEHNSVFKYDYVVFDNDQVHPKYLIDFYFDESKETNLKIPNCEYEGCGEIATLYCINDQVNLCGKCNEEIHERGGLIAKKHKVVPIEDKPKDFGYCQSHPKTKNQFFCRKCKIPLCIYCKINNGSHATGENAKHKLENIEDAYARAVHEANVIDDRLEKHKAVLRSRLQRLDDKITEINGNARAVESDLFDEMRRALEALQSQTQTKLNILLANQMELRRQYEEIQWAESFLKYQIEVLSPQHYLTSWARHLEKKDDLIINHDFGVDDVKPDLRLIGSVYITTEAALKKADGTKKEAPKDPDTYFSKNLIGQNVMTPSKKNSIGTSIYKAVKKKPEFNAKLMGLGTETKEGIYKYQRMYLNIGNTNSNNKRHGDNPMNMDSTGGFASEAHNRMDLLKNKYDESTLNQYISKLFKSSEIIHDHEEDRNKGSLLYHSIPLLDNNLYDMKLLKTFKKGQAKLAKASDIKDLFEEEQNPSIFLFQNEVDGKVYKFGGFADRSWYTINGNSGDDTCFLFSLTEMIKFRYNSNPPNKKHVHLWSNGNSLSFGKKDLVCHADGTWESEVENNYTSGFKSGDVLRNKTILAGENKFTPDIFEVWALIKLDNINGR